MKRLFFFSLAFTIAITGCKKETVDDENFEKGIVIIGIDSTVSMQKTFNYLNTLGLPIQQANGFTFTSTLDKSQIPFITDLLNSKSYINNRSFSAYVYEHYQTGVVYNATTLWDMTRANQKDYISTLKNLKMTEQLNSYRDIIIRVPIGKEKYWRKRLEKAGWVAWATLNYHITIHLWE
ncbi:MAG: hypothetical protein J5I50_06275 [Chitinophagaceae bacterium]|nr:hypothetical protein [Chitinophagaceae bacterium]